ncbi:hypothetical protein A9995_12405 [Erythrobacter sp. QSSC1-22B]|uniref:DUF2842 domain-containing protein n=1 Tax=Erythrobacter sp. QSSC1-22B TaxID=1860125 RepID=UPI0008054150|nr:DUF2842 domain-containing protein [Erythrobacter sp. QSSC1-22B]OBX18282.1 hypothetical protein A9995_12405 [Erythrobacter sp. QSSC1-22B]
MREEPTLRIPFGVLALLMALLAYGIVVATFIPPLIASWHTFVQTLVYLVLGLIWLLPLRRFLIWMETGNWG